ncbi:putative secondary metabolism biosynthetic enzyme [Diaporthe eres]|uniref:Secondary metabolism biosynthetic enzyme n=1 Tax=Diaporthe eres TaxID=83184 RepID=A0ABR1P3N8_DIAER
MESASEENFNKVLEIIAGELGVEVDELQDADVPFSQLGIDPILGRVIVRKISQDLGFQLAEDVFQKVQDVGHFRQHVVKSHTVPATKTDLSAIWARGIQKIQPHGPYRLGGWSAGGYYAFEVMKYLQSEGEAMDKIVLIDSPCRTKFETLPLDVVRYLSSHQLMGDKDSSQTPKWLVDHFEVTLNAVEQYKPAKMSVVPVEAAPDVHIIWATDGVLPRGGATQAGLDCGIKVTRFLLEERIDLGPNGWETLFTGASKIFIATMPGNHFNIVYKPYVQNIILIDCDSSFTIFA